MESNVSFIQALRKELTKRRIDAMESYNTASDFNSVCKIKGRIHEIDHLGNMITELLDKHPHLRE